MSIYETPISRLSGSGSPLSDAQGKVALVVNVASKCGLTPQYTALQALQTEARHPLYSALVDTQDAEGYAGDIRWNFEKFVVDRSGKVVARFHPKTEPNAPEVIAAITAALG